MGDPAKFQTRRQSIEAIQFDGTKECAQRIVRWSNGVVEDDTHPLPMVRMISVTTPDGRQNAIHFDWIIKDAGGFWVCADDIFRRKYEPEVA